MSGESERSAEAELVRAATPERRSRTFGGWKSGVLLDWSDVDKAMFIAALPMPMLLASLVRVCFILGDPSDEPYLSRPVLSAIRWSIAVYATGVLGLLPIWSAIRSKIPGARPFVRAALFLFGVTGALSAYFVGHFSTPIMGAVVAGAIAVLLLFDARTARPVLIIGGIALFGPIPFIAVRMIPYAPLYASAPFTGTAPPPNWLYMSAFFSVVFVTIPVWILMSVLERWRKRDEEIHRLARLDGLTEIPNRRYFLERLEAELARASRYGSNAALLLFDLDHFKRVNDRFGHHVGDQALRHVADLLSSDVVRRIDVVGRYGGEEFAVLLPETDIEGALVVAERIRLALAAEPLVRDGRTVALTTSIGVAVYPAPTVTDLESLVRRADGALYRAKENGRNRVETEPLEDRDSLPE